MAAKIVDADREKQDPNRFETGSETARAAAYLAEITREWREHRWVVLLRALCRLTADDPARGETGFTSLDLVEQVRKEGLEDFGGTTGGEDPDRLRKIVKKHFDQLLERWPERRQGVIERFRDHGLALVPAISREEGGGRGHPTRYRLGFTPESVDPAGSDRQPAPVDADYPVRYFTDEVVSRRLFRWLARQGYALDGWRGRLFAGVMLVAAVGLLGLMLVLWLALIHQATVLGFLSTMGSLITLTVLAWLVGRPLLTLADNRIVLAPWWLQPRGPAHDDQLLELRHDPALGVNVILLTRYTADCPSCGGKLAIASGRREFHGRLVGRCNRAPNEHVFSFDPVLRRGKSLR